VRRVLFDEDVPRQLRQDLASFNIRTVQEQGWSSLKMVSLSAMVENKSSLSGSRSYEELSEYWDTHSLADHWDQTSPVGFELDVKSSTLYLPVDRLLADKLRAVAASHGVSTETLLNLWLQERVADEAHKAG
jgi:hypothetical protein